MAENETTVENEKPVKPKKDVKGAVKEYFRKLTVKLKRQTHIIPLILTLIASLAYMCMIGTFSQVVEVNSGIAASGICMFVNTLVSILVLPCFLNAFPKRKKPQIPFIVAVGVLMVLLIALDLAFYININKYVVANKISLARNPKISETYTSLIVHIVLVAVAGIAFAFLPLYKKGINKINTKKTIESNNLSAEIDTEEDV